MAKSAGKTGKNRNRGQACDLCDSHFPQLTLLTPDLTPFYSDAFFTPSLLSSRYSPDSLHPFRQQYLSICAVKLPSVLSCRILAVAASYRRRRPINDLTPPRACVLSS